MPAIQWTPEMRIGFESIDADHKMLVGLINQLDEAISTGRGEETVRTVLDALLDYTNYHFAREERMMAACGYPDFGAHAHSHQVLKTQVMHIRDRYLANPETVHVREVLNLMSSWLTSHILGRDKLYAPFMAARREEVERAEREFAERVSSPAVPPQTATGSGS